MSWRLNKNCNILTPSSSGYSSTSFSSCGAAQSGALRAQLSAGSGSHCFELQQLTPNSDLQLTRTSCCTGLYNCLTYTCFSERRICTQFNPSTVKVSPDIFDRTHLLFTQVHFLFDSSAVSEVNMLYSQVFRVDAIVLIRLKPLFCQLFEPTLIPVLVLQGEELHH